MPQRAPDDRPETEAPGRVDRHVQLLAVAAPILSCRTPVLAAAVLWLEAGNAAMHVTMGIARRRYNPGVGTAALLMGPHALLGARRLRRSGRLDHRAAAASAAVGFCSAVLHFVLKLRMRGRAAPYVLSTAR